MKTKLLVFGITGDLSTRKLLPALDAILRAGEYDEIEIIGVSRTEAKVEDILKSSVEISSPLFNKLSIFSMNVAQADEYIRLRDHIGLKSDEQLIIYLSVPPNAAAQIADFLGEATLNTPNVKLLFEKPFGVDHVSATEFIARTKRYFSEERIYRIDHYLAKEMAQNIITFRGGNALFSYIWDRQAIEKIEIVATEKIGIEGRANFYEQTGALRDVLQGHLMQLLSLILMEIPDKFDWEDLPKLRSEALSKLQSADPSRAVRAQYEGYEQEVNNVHSTTETFALVELFSKDPRWKDVPLTLVTGKGMDVKTTEVRIYLRKKSDARSNRLTFRIQPNEGVEIELFAKKPGYERKVESKNLSFVYPEDEILPDAYEQVIVDAIRSNKSLFASSSEVLYSWSILQPILDAWSMDASNLRQYPVGSATHNICSVSKNN